MRKKKAKKFDEMVFATKQAHTGKRALEVSLSAMDAADGTGVDGGDAPGMLLVLKATSWLGLLSPPAQLLLSHSG